MRSSPTAGLPDRPYVQAVGGSRTVRARALRCSPSHDRTGASPLPDPTPAAPSGLLLLANANAGTADQEAVEAARTVLAATGDVELVTTGEPDELDRALDRLDGRRLVVAGGDGSLHLVVRRLHERGELAAADLALVPLGTGNDLARSLGIPLEPEAAAELAGSGQAHPLDLLLDDAGGTAVNAVHVGIGAQAAQAASGLKPRLGPLAYPIGAVLAGLRAPGWRLRVEVDGRVVSRGRRRVLMVGIGNGPGIGGGTPLLPHARPDDGLLDVMVSLATGPLARARFGVALRDGQHLASRQVRSARGRVVTVRGGPARSTPTASSARRWSAAPGGRNRLPGPSCARHRHRVRPPRTGPRPTG